MKKGFSLIELSVVIVIIGLLVGVLVAARSIRNTAQVQAVISDFGKYKQAAVQYKEKYYYWPGDDPGAGSVWAELNGGHGDGNGQIGDNTDYCIDAGCIDFTEPPLAFQELALAGFITGDYIHGGSATINVGGDYFPKAPIDMVSGGNLVKPIYYYIYQSLGPTNNSPLVTSVNKNTINIYDAYTSSINPVGGNHGPQTAKELEASGALKPSDALAIDIKIDDGNPTTGYVRGLDNDNVTGSNCTSSGSYWVAGDSNDGKCISSFSIE